MAKTNLYDTGIRLPFIARNPLQIRRGITNSAMVSFADVFPTVLEWARLPKSGGRAHRGRSLLPILEETSPSGWDEVYASQSFHEVTMYYPMRAVRTRQHSLIVNLAHPLSFPIAEDLFESETWQGVIHHTDPVLGDRSLADYLQRKRVELYDVLADPHQRKNLALDPALGATLRDLQERLRDWQEKTDDPWLIKNVHE
jgi:N-sulfoglucosamine sulfohydrolase